MIKETGGGAPGDFPTPIFDVVLKHITVRGSIVGTRKDLSEAIAFAVEGKVKTTTTTRRLDETNAVFDAMKRGAIDGRVVPAMRCYSVTGATPLRGRRFLPIICSTDNASRRRLPGAM